MLLCSPLHGTTIAVVNRAEVYEGHPFVVEAAVAIGGPKAQPVCGDQAAVNSILRLSTTMPVLCLVWSQGIKVFRFANRIPLLFEAGSDVGTVVATKKIKCV